MRNTIVERLAEYAHEAWSGWMKYFFGKGKFSGISETEISFTISKKYYENLLKQINSSYSDLTEEEKDLDRKEARRIMQLIDEDAKEKGD